MEDCFLESERIYFGGNKMGKRKLAKKTIVKMQVVVREFRFMDIVFVVALLLRKLLRHVLVGMERLRQHCKQHRQHQKSIYYGQSLFHPGQR
jgi:hypothetical protein